MIRKKNPTKINRQRSHNLAPGQVKAAENGNS
jgi:hypothetical protein